MTPQQIFDKVATHLFTQNAKALNEHDSVIACVYRSTDGKSCAIGCLIDDETYEPGMENKSFDRLMGSRYKAVLPPWFSPNYQLLQALQRCHDGQDVDHWRHKLTEIADDFGLNKDVLQ